MTTIQFDLDKSSEYVRQAIAISAQNVAEGGKPFGTVIVKDDRVIATGRVMVHLIKDPTLHSEIVAIREACRVLDSLELTGCDVYAISHPCPMCLGALYFAKPRAVFFAQSMEDKMRLGFGKGDLYSQFALPFDKRDLPMVQISQRLQEANDVFVKYQQMHP